MSSERSERPEPYLLAITNQKGGVGKSTLAINVAGALANRDHEILVVDTDPQGYLTEGVGLSEVYNAEPPSLYDALMEPDEHDPHDLVHSHPEFDVLPSNIDMFTLEQELVTAMRGRERLGMVLEQITDYEYVIVDAPPSLGHIADNVILGCRNLLIPAEAEDTSIRALEHLFNQVETLENRYETQIHERALVVSNVDYPLDNEQKGMIDWFNNTFEGRCPVFEVRNRAAIKRAWNEGLSIFAHDEECDMEPILDEIAAHFETEDARMEVVR